MVATENLKGEKSKKRCEGKSEKREGERENIYIKERANRTEPVFVYCDVQSQLKQVNRGSFAKGHKNYQV